MYELIECLREHRNNAHVRNIILRAICASGHKVKCEIEKLLAPKCEAVFLKARPSTAPNMQPTSSTKKGSERFAKPPPFPPPRRQAKPTAVPRPSKSNGDEMSKHAVEHMQDEAEAGQDEMTEQGCYLRVKRSRWM